MFVLDRVAGAVSAVKALIQIFEARLSHPSPQLALHIARTLTDFIQGQLPLGLAPEAAASAASTGLHGREAVVVATRFVVGLRWDSSGRVSSKASDDAKRTAPSPFFRVVSPPKVPAKVESANDATPDVTLQDPPSVGTTSHADRRMSGESIGAISTKNALDQTGLATMLDPKLTDAEMHGGSDSSSKRMPPPKPPPPHTRARRPTRVVPLGSRLSGASG